TIAFCRHIYSAKREERGAACFVWRHSQANVVVDVCLQVGVQLGGELMIAPCPPQDLRRSRHDCECAMDQRRHRRHMIDAGVHRGGRRAGMIAAADAPAMTIPAAAASVSGSLTGTPKTI